MTTDSQYSWTSFYMELADKLLAFKDDRQALIATLRRVYAQIGMALPTLDSSGDPTDIDPFTVFGLFNRTMSKLDRKRVALGMARHFRVVAAIPEDLSVIPALSGRNARFSDSARNTEAEIDTLWLLFACALRYADKPNVIDGTNFCSYFDSAVKQEGVSWNITMGLFWVRPYTYANLWLRDRQFLSMPGRMPELIGTWAASIRRIGTGSDYLMWCNMIRGAMKKGQYAYTTFPELSACVLRPSELVNRENKEADKKKEEVAQAAVLGDADVQNVRYWLYAPGRGACMWDEFYERGVMGLGWHELGDLRGYATKEEMRQRLLETRDDSTSQTNSARAVWQFANEMKPGDVIFVKRGLKEIIGRGVVTGDYVYDPDGGEYPHLRDVSWNRQGSWRSDQQFAMKTLTEITDYPDLLARIEAYFENDEDSLDSEQMPVPLTEYSAAQFLNEVYMGEERYDAIVGLLRAKKNIIMQGAPGVGKTYAAKRLAYSMMGVKDASRVMLVQFHQSYSYEDFIEGYRPSGAGFELVKGAFYSFCKKAADDEENAYFFIIDEINRGNLSKIFGELFMLIESDKRGYKLQLLYSHELFYVPRNFHIIGMMNTADRSLALLDYALRRRFAFVELRPAFDSEGFRDYCSGLDNPRFEALVREVESLNRAIAEDESLGEGFCIGHSYFCNMKPETCTDAALASIVDYELIPMLKEYWFDEPGKVRDWTDRLRRSLR